MNKGGFGGDMNQSTPAPAAALVPLGELAELPTMPGPDVIRQCDLTRKILDYDPKADTGLIDAAYDLAEKAHSTQRRENGDPYFSHPVAVADILAGYHLDVASIATALLHDVVEDTSYKLSEIESRFGKEIAGLVDGVTKLTRLELQSDRTKQAENFRKLVLAMSRDIRVLLETGRPAAQHADAAFRSHAGEAQTRRPRDDGNLRAAG
jgi:GTP pyrophosphokinase